MTTQANEFFVNIFMYTHVPKYINAQLCMHMNIFTGIYTYTYMHIFNSKSVRELEGV